MWNLAHRGMAAALLSAFVLLVSSPATAFERDAQAVVYWGFTFGGPDAGRRQTFGLRLGAPWGAPDPDPAHPRPLQSEPGLNLYRNRGLALDSMTVNGVRLVSDAQSRFDGESTVLGIRVRTIATVMAIAGGVTILIYALSQTL